jgi:uncharacterized repeat protein (TIGR03803 family)
LTPDGDLTFIHIFKGGKDGAHPIGPLVQATDGALYGVTSAGGSSKDCGTIFRLFLDETFTTIHAFNCGGEGGVPAGGLIQGVDGRLYGMTMNGGHKNLGIAYSIGLAGDFAVLGSFSGKRVGSVPAGEFVQVNDGRLFGIMTQGAPENGGSLFSVTPQGVITRLHSFTSNEDPVAGLAYSSKDNSVYGIIEGGSVYRYRNRKFSSVSKTQYPAMGGLSFDPEERTLYGYCGFVGFTCIDSIDVVSGDSQIIAQDLAGPGAGRPGMAPDRHLFGATQDGGTHRGGTVFTVQGN